jgi:hypothetical protein
MSAESGGNRPWTGLDHVSMSSTERRLLDLYRMLGGADQETLLALAEFLRQRGVSTPVSGPAATIEIPDPVPIPRPAHESVVAGLKRLSKTYPMLSKTEMLNATSELVARHVMQGTEPAQVIDRLEDIFREHYRNLREGGAP